MVFIINNYNALNLNISWEKRDISFNLSIVFDTNKNNLSINDILNGLLNVLNKLLTDGKYPKDFKLSVSKQEDIITSSN